jgi:FkbM family methyltransferase
MWPLTLPNRTMEHRQPFYQVAIRRLPLKRESAARALGFLFGSGVRSVVNGASLKLDLQEMIQRSMFLGTYEPTQTAWFNESLRPGDVVLDVGASFGYYTTLASKLVGPNGRVFAFEPSPVASRGIEFAIENSKLTNVQLVKAALGKEPGSVSLFLPTAPGLHSPSILKNDPSYVPVEVPVLVLDEFEPLKSFTRIKLVKIDVEGYEPDVLAGMEKLARANKIDNVICEFNSGWLKRNATTSKQLLEQFLDLGFRIHRQTALQRDLVGHNDERFDLQDIWFSMP